MSDYNISVDQKASFDENIKYMIDQIEKNLKNIDMLKQDFYFETSKKQVVNSFNSVLSSLKCWQQHFNDSEIYHIQKNYKELESNVSALELCLADYDDIFHCEGISYALYQIGNLLSEILRKKGVIKMADKKANN